MTYWNSWLELWVGWLVWENEGKEKSRNGSWINKDGSIQVLVSIVLKSRSPVCNLLTWTIKFPLFSGIVGWIFIWNLSEENLLKGTGCSPIRTEYWWPTCDVRTLEMYCYYRVWLSYLESLGQTCEGTEVSKISHYGKWLSPSQIFFNRFSVLVFQQILLLEHYTNEKSKRHTIFRFLKINGHILEMILTSEYLPWNHPSMYILYSAFSLYGSIASRLNLQGCHYLTLPYLFSLISLLLAHDILASQM